MDIPHGGVNGGAVVQAGRPLLPLRGRDDVLLGRLLVEHVALVVHGGEVARRPAAEEVVTLAIFKINDPWINHDLIDPRKKRYLQHVINTREYNAHCGIIN